MPVINTKPIYAVRVVSGSTELTVPDTSYVGTGANTQAVVAATKLSRVDRIEFHAIGNNAATICRVYKNNGTDHTSVNNNKPQCEVRLPATAASTTVPLPTVVKRFRGLWMLASEVLMASVTTACGDGWRVEAILHEFES